MVDPPSLHLLCLSVQALLRPAQLPEGARLPELRQGAKPRREELRQAKDVVRLQALAEQVNPEQGGVVPERHDAVGAVGVEQGPVSNVLFRPEEVHEASGPRDVLAPARERHIDVTNDGRRRSFQDLPVPHPHLYRLIAVQAGAVDLDLLAGVEPANC
jgi:hypothetical protein